VRFCKAAATHPHPPAASVGLRGPAAKSTVGASHLVVGLGSGPKFWRLVSLCETLGGLVVGGFWRLVSLCETLGGLLERFFKAAVLSTYLSEAELW